MYIRISEQLRGYNKNLFMLERAYQAIKEPSFVTIEFGSNIIEIKPSKQDKDYLYDNDNLKVSQMKNNAGYICHRRFSRIKSKEYFCRLVITPKINYLRVFDIEYNH